MCGVTVATIATFISAQIANATIAISTAAAAAGASAGVVGAIATVGTEVGALAAGAVTSLGFAGGLGSAISAWSTVAAIAEVALFKPNIPSYGQAQQFLADPSAPIPFVVGRFGVGGNLIYQTTSGGSNRFGAGGNQYLGNVVVLSGLGPVQSIESYKMNDTFISLGGATGQGVVGGEIPAGTFTRFATSFTLDGSSNAINNIYDGCMFINSQLGTMPQAYLAQPTNPHAAAPTPEWDSTHGLSGFCALHWTLAFNNGTYAGGLPKMLVTLGGGIPTYDPRHDSTYTGGSGTQRWATRSTWGYSTNPYIHALNFALGYYLPDPVTAAPVLYAGIGASGPGQVDVAAFVAGANIADANSWTIGGRFTSKDDKNAVLTAMLQCGGGQPIPKAGAISCTVSTPQTSAFTITPDMLTGGVTVDTGAPIRNKISRVFPRFSSEPHGWAMTPLLAPITGATYVTEDGGLIRSKGLDYQFVTNVNQCAQLAAYDIANSREGVVAVIPGKPAVGTCKVGTCVTVNLPDCGLASFKMLVIKREIDFQTGGFTLTCQSETDAKHAFALGVSGTAPPTPQLTGVDASIVAAPYLTQWAATVATVTDATTGETTQVIRITGDATDNPYTAHIVVDYKQALTFDPVTHLPLTYSAVSTQSYAATTTSIDLNVNAGKWDVQMAYITNQGGISAVTLDLGLQTVGGSTSFAALSSLTIGGYTAAQVANANIPGNANGSRDSEFQFGGAFWNYVNTITGLPLTQAVDVLDSGQTSCLRMSITGTPPVSTYAQFGQQPKQATIGVTPGQVVEASGYVDGTFSASGAVSIYVNWYDKTGVAFSNSLVGTTGVTGFATSITGMIRLGGFVTAPALAYYAGIDCVGFSGLIPSANPSFRLAKPFIRAANPYQTVLSAYSPGEISTWLADQTALNTAAGIISQGPWATTSIPIAGVVTPLPNLIVNPTFTLGTAPWIMANAGTATSATGKDNALGWIWLSQAQGVTNYATIFEDVAVYANNLYSVGVNLYDPTGSAGNTGRFYLQYLDATKTHSLGVVGPINATSGGGYDRHKIEGLITPSVALGAAFDTAFIRIVADTFGRIATGGASYAIGQVKLENAALCSVYTDDSTPGAAYLTGATIDSLRPGQINSDVTGTNTALAVLGQGALATLGSISWSSGFLTSIPANLAALLGTEAVQNALLQAALTGGSVVPATAGGITGQAAAATDPTIQSGATVNLTYNQGTDPALSVTVPDGAVWRNSTTGASYLRHGGVWVLINGPQDGSIILQAIATTGPVSGAYTVLPTDLPFMVLTMQAADGGSSSFGAGHSGGSGGVIVHHIAVVAGDVITWSAGSAGANVSTGTAGTGGDCSASSSSPSFSLTAHGGVGANNTHDGAGGAASGGNVSNTPGTLAMGSSQPGSFTIRASLT
jgi:hypothetical protein